MVNTLIFDHEFLFFGQLDTTFQWFVLFFTKLECPFFKAPTMFQTDSNTYSNIVYLRHITYI